MPKHYNGRNRKPAGVGSLLKYALKGATGLGVISEFALPGEIDPEGKSDFLSPEFNVPERPGGKKKLAPTKKAAAPTTTSTPGKKMVPGNKKRMTPKKGGKTPLKVNIYRGTTPTTAKSPGPGGEYSPSKKKKVMQRTTTKGDSAFSVKSVLKNPWAYAVGGGLATLALYNILSGDDEKKGGPPKDPVTPGRYTPRW